LRQPLFRRIWLASLLSSLGFMILWRRVPVPSRLLPERIDRAVHADIR